MLAERKKILLRADGNSKSGLGHMYRILAVAEALSAQHECLILSRASSSIEIVGKSYPLAIIPDFGADDEASWLEEHYSPRDWTLVADGYHFTGDYQKYIKEKGYYFIYIDDLIRGHYYADVVVNHSLAARFMDYDAEPYTRFALGTDYALLRKKFMTAPVGKMPDKKRSAAFVCFGGADPSHLSAKAAGALADLNQIRSVHVVVGAVFSKDALSDLVKISDKITVHVNLGENELSNLMLSCDFAISSASTVLYELCALHVPTLAGFYVPNQEGLYHGFEMAGAIHGAGDISKFEKQNFKDAIEKFVAQPSWEIYSHAQQKLFDGKSHERLLLLLNRVYYRNAGEQDVMQVFDWSNDQVTRANSYSTAPIELGTHKLWFEKKVRDPRTNMFIAEYDGIPAGLIRYDMNEDQTVVGVLIDAKFRGKGLATMFLRDTARIFFSEHKMPVYAYIKIQNLPSLKAFEKAGYKFLEEKVVQGAPSYIYKITENDV